MYSTMKNILLLLSLSLLFSCSVQKRKYQKGFYVNRTQHKPPLKKERSSLSTKTEIVNRQDSKKPILLVTGDRPQAAEATNRVNEDVAKKSTLTPFQAPPDTCDLLVFKDGSEILAKVLEVAPADIKYKRCDNKEGPTYVTRKADLFMIKYTNGTKEVMKTEAAPQEFQSYNPSPQPRPRYDKKKAETHPRAILALALGVLSIASIFIGSIVVSSVNTPSGGSGGFSPLIIGISAVSALLAVIFGTNAVNEIKESDGLYKGKGQAVPGLIMGWVMLGIWLLVLLFFLMGV